MKKLFWGIIFILAAVLIVLSCAGINLGFIGILPITDILLAALLLSLVVSAVSDRNYWFIPYPLAVIFMLFENEIAISLGRNDTNLISNWLVLLCALIFSIGIGLIASGLRHGKKKVFNINNHSKEEAFNINIHHGKEFSNETKYIDCTSLDDYWYKVKMGSGELFFTNVENYKGGGVLNVECRAGNIEIHVPSGWHLKTDIETNMGNTEIAGTGKDDGPLFTIKGTNTMGNIEITFC